MRVSRLELDGVGPFEGAFLDVPPPANPRGEGELVLFEGPNGAGKSTIAELIAVAAGSRVEALAGD